LQSALALRGRPAQILLIQAPIPMQSCNSYAWQSNATFSD
jgi:hypothetical protein